jgi:hypothetical protein
MASSWRISAAGDHGTFRQLSPEGAGSVSFAKERPDNAGGEPRVLAATQQSSETSGH